MSLKFSGLRFQGILEPLLVEGGSVLLQVEQESGCLLSYLEDRVRHKRKDHWLKTFLEKGFV